MPAKAMSTIFVLTLAVVLGGCDLGPSSVQVHVDAPDDYIHGGVFKLHGAYERNGEIISVKIDDRLLYTDESFVVPLSGREHGDIRELRAELRHPKYRPVSEVLSVGKDSEPVEITVRPVRWTTNERHTWIEPSHETLKAGMEHLRWIRTEYFQRPERLPVNEAFQKDHRLVALLAYGGGGKKGEWEALRQETIVEWKALAEIMEERSYEPCPEGYEFEGMVNRPCGARKFEVTYIPRVSAEERKAKEEEQFRQMKLAIEDLAGRKQIDINTIRSANYSETVWETTALGCPEEGVTYEEVATPGYFLILQPPYETYFYHGKANEDPFYCEEDQRTY